MNEFEVKARAEDFISKQEMRGFKMRFVEVRKRVRYPAEWSAIFDIYNPEGGLIDGPAIVIVDDETGEARFFEAP